MLGGAGAMLRLVLLNVKNVVILLCLLREVQKLKNSRSEAVERPEKYRAKCEALRHRILFIWLRDAPHFFLNDCW